MPTNVSPEYKKAQEQYRKAREPADRLKFLREMLSTIPKHKGTEALQAARVRRRRAYSAHCRGRAFASELCRPSDTQETGRPRACQ